MRIAIMQAYIDGKTIERRLPGGEWMTCNEPEFVWDREYRVKPEPKLPTSWKEFCETTPVQKGEMFIDVYGSIYECDYGVKRCHESDVNNYPTKELAEAALAQAQLLQLRKAYVGDWEPNWTDSNKKKYLISNGYDDEVAIYIRSCSRHWLSFPNNELAEKFFNNFRDLIEKVKPLL